MADQNYWVRTEQGRTWGPYTLAALERLRGQLTEKCDASTDGSERIAGHALGEPLGERGEQRAQQQKIEGHAGGKTCGEDLTGEGRIDHGAGRQRFTDSIRAGWD